MKAVERNGWHKRLLSHQAVKQERLLLFTGVAGVVLGGICLLIILARGAVIFPEGDLFKAVSFNIAVGTFLITTAIILPFVRLSLLKRRMIRLMLTIATLYSYAVETIQHLRGINPRFTQAGDVMDQIFGGLFGLTSLLIIVVYVLLAFHLFKKEMLTEKPLFTIGLRYGVVSTLLAFAGGLWMIVLQGRFFGMEGNIIWFHGLGFHGLQAIPILVWLATKTAGSKKVKINWIHLGGLGWILSVLMIGVQTALGKSLFELTFSSVASMLFMAVWLTAFIVLFRKFVQARNTESIALWRAE